MSCLLMKGNPVKEIKLALSTLKSKDNMYNQGCDKGLCIGGSYIN